MRTVVEGRDLLAHDGDAIVGREDRPLPGIAGDTNDQLIDDARRAQNDIGVPVGDRIESAGVNAYPHLGHRSPPALPDPAARDARPPQLSEGAGGASSFEPPPPSLPLSSTPFSSPMSPSRATETTCSPSPTLKTTTPWLGRRARMSKTGQRITVPPSVTSMIWSLWVTGNTATTWS